MKSFLSAILILLCFPVFSCENDSLSNKGKWSAGIILMNQAYSPVFGFQPNLFPGIIVRRDMGKFRLRAATEMHLYRSRSIPFLYPDASYTTEKSFGGTVRFGIEKGWNIKNRVRPYIGMDAAAAFDKSSVTEVGGIIGLSREYFNSRKAVGFLPTAGIEFMISKRFSLSAETQAGLFIVNEHEKTIYYQGNIDSRPVSSTYFDFSLSRPVAVAIHFNF